VYSLQEEFFLLLLLLFLFLEDWLQFGARLTFYNTPALTFYLVFWIGSYVFAQSRSQTTVILPMPPM
jgi:hypothetical protein